MKELGRFLEVVIKLKTIPLGRINLVLNHVMSSRHVKTQTFMFLSSLDKILEDESATGNKVSAQEPEQEKEGPRCGDVLEVSRSDFKNVNEKSNPVLVV